jgi:hypothetical protein
MGQRPGAPHALRVGGVEREARIRQLNLSLSEVNEEPGLRRAFRVYFGEGEIRTLETLITSARFRGGCLQPLDHLSVAYVDKGPLIRGGG